MVLESLVGTNVNIKNLTLESPKRNAAEIDFDPERGISEENWQEMMQDFNSLQAVGTGDSARNLRVMLALKTAAPERFGQLTHRDRYLTGARNVLENQLNTLLDLSIIELEELRELIFVDPKSVEGISVADKWSYIKGWWDTKGNYEGDKRYLQNWLSVTLAFPDKKQEVNLRSTIKDEVDANLEGWRDEKNLGFGFPAYNFGELVFLAKTALPEAKFDVRAEDIKAMKEEMQRNINAKKWLPAVGLMLFTKAALAERIEMTDKGLNFVMPNQNRNFEARVEPLPAARKF